MIPQRWFIVAAVTCLASIPLLRLQAQTRNTGDISRQIFEDDSAADWIHLSRSKPRYLLLSGDSGSNEHSDLSGDSNLGNSFVSSNEPVYGVNPVDSDGSSGTITAGVALYFLRPFSSNNTAFSTTTGIGTPTTALTNQEFDWSYNLAPAVWLGWSDPTGVGVRARFFHLDQDSGSVNSVLDVANAATTSISPPSGLSPLLGIPLRGLQSPGILLQDSRGQDTLSAQSSLRIQTIDTEVTLQRDWGALNVLWGAGGRYLQMNQGYQLSLVNFIDPLNNETSNLNAIRDFSGFGPTFSAQCSRRIGSSNFSVVGLARGSYLVGTSQHSGTFSETIIDSINGNQTNVGTDRSSNHVALPIIDLEGGVEYGRSVGSTFVFVRGTCVSSTYFGAGNASSTDGNLNLFGAMISTGLNF